MLLLNSVRHFVILLMIGFVASFTFSNGISLFAIHPPLMLTGFLLLMTEAIMVFNQNSYQNFTYKKRLDLHTKLQFVAAIIISFGILAIKYSHFAKHNTDTSLYNLISNVGYSSLILCGVAFGSGILTRYAGTLKLPVKLIKIFHALFGSVAYYLGLNAICAGLNGSWLQSYVSQNVIYGLMAAVTVIGIAAIYTPIQRIYNRANGLLGKAKKR